jgi:hypothetical protein
MSTSPSRAKLLINRFGQVQLNQVFENMTHFVHGAPFAFSSIFTDLLEVNLAVRVAGLVRFDPSHLHGDQKTGAY